MPAVLTVPLHSRLRNPGTAYITGPVTLASHIRTWPIREFCRFFSSINALPAAADESGRLPSGTLPPRAPGGGRELAGPTGLVHRRWQLLRQDLGELIDRDVESRRQLLD